MGPTGESDRCTMVRNALDRATIGKIKKFPIPEILLNLATMVLPEHENAVLKKF